MLILRVDDVGRKPGDDPEHGTDGDLSYFSQWRRLCGLEGLSAVYGIVPAWIKSAGHDWLNANINLPERRAVHGYDHGRHRVVSSRQMQEAGFELQALSYIPPFNQYNAMTMQHWNQAGGRYFFGGIDGEHHEHGPKPKLIHNVVHIPACFPLYGHAEFILSNVGCLPSITYPAVLTLHVPWDRDFNVVKTLVDRIKSFLAPVTSVEDWLVQNP